MAALAEHKAGYILVVVEHKGNYMYFEVDLLDKDIRLADLDKELDHKASLLGVVKFLQPFHLKIILALVPRYQLQKIDDFFWQQQAQ